MKNYRGLKRQPSAVASIFITLYYKWHTSDKNPTNTDKVSYEVEVLNAVDGNKKEKYA